MFTYELKTLLQPFIGLLNDRSESSLILSDIMFGTLLSLNGLNLFNYRFI